MLAPAQKTDRDRSENKEKTGVQLKGVAALIPRPRNAFPYTWPTTCWARTEPEPVMAVPALMNATSSSQKNRSS